MPLAQVKISRLVRGEGDGLGPPVPGLRKWSMRAGKVLPAPVSDDRRSIGRFMQEQLRYKQTPGFEQFRHKVLTGRPFPYRAFLDRPFPDPGLQVGVATHRMLPAVHPWGRYTVPHPGRQALTAKGFPAPVVRFPDRPTLSEATGYYTASEEALGLGDPALGGFFKKVFKKIGSVVQKVIPKEVLKVATIIAAPLVAPIARTGILGEEAKKTSIKVLKVVSPIMRAVAPALSFIPGIGVPLAAGVSITGQMLGTRKPLTIFRKPLAVFGEAAAAAAIGPGVKFAMGMFGSGGAPESPTGNVSTSEVLREAAAGTGEYEIPPPMPETAWGTVASTVGKVATGLIPVASQLLQRYQGSPEGASDPRVLNGGWGSVVYDGSGQPRYLPGPGPAEGAYIPGSVGYEGAPAEAGPVGAPGMVQEAGMFGGPMMPLLMVGGVVALLFATRR